METLTRTRTPRSIIANVSKESGLMLVDEENTILYKKVPHVKAMKTSFVSPVLSRRSNKPVKAKAGWSDVVKYEATGFASKRPNFAKLAAPIKLAGSYNRSLLQSLVERINSNDLKFSWLLNSALNDIANLRRLVDQLGTELRFESNHTRSISSIRQSSLTRERMWLPKTNDLTRRTKGFEASMEILSNLSRYLEYFAVAFEQSIFERTNEGSLSRFQEVERVLLMCICDLNRMESLLRLLDSDFMKLAKEWNEHRDKSIIPFEILNASVMESVRRRLYYQGDTLDSPTSLSHADRSVMPSEQRTLSPVERSVRDLSIIGDLNELLVFLDKIMRRLLT